MRVPCVAGIQASPCACPNCWDLTVTAHRAYPPRCPKCGKWVPWSAVEGEDWLDNDNWYGVSTREWTNCPRCGRQDGARYY